MPPHDEQNAVKPQPSALDSAINQNAEAIADLGMNLDLLKKALRPVLRNIPSVDDSKESDPDKRTTSPVVEAIQHSTDSVRRLTAEVSMLLSTLDT